MKKTRKIKRSKNHTNTGEKYPKKDESNMPAGQETSEYKLHEAMRLVLLDADEYTMHAAALADEIYNGRLYLQKNGGKAKYNQIRAICSHYPDIPVFDFA